MDDNKRARALANANVYYQAEPVNASRAIRDVRLFENRERTGEPVSGEGRHDLYSVAEPVRQPARRFSPEEAKAERERSPVNPSRAMDVRPFENRHQRTGEPGSCEGRHTSNLYSVAEPVRPPARRFSPGEFTTEGECSPGRQENVYEEAVAVAIVIRPEEASLDQGTGGNGDRTQAKKGVPQPQDGQQCATCCGVASSSRLLCATVALVTLVVIVTTLVALATLLPSHQIQTPSLSSLTTVTVSPTERNTTSAVTGKTSPREHVTPKTSLVTLPRTTTEETPALLLTTGQVPPADAVEVKILIGGKGSGPGQFQNPRGVTVAENEIFVADVFNRRVQVFNFDGVFLRLFAPVSGGHMLTPHDVTIDGDGSLWVLGKHAFGGVVRKYTRVGRSVGKRIPLRTSAFSRGIAANPKNSRVLVTETDGREGHVLMFRPDGTLERRFGRREGMQHPWFVATDAEGNIVVSDYDTNYVYMYDQSGWYLGRFGGRGRFRHPAGLCVDGRGNIAVADSGSRRVEVVTGRGRHVRYAAASGRWKPSGVALGPGGQMVVTYGLQNVVAIFKP
ncbi:hypothetical protein Bbelb_229580 [Branchiostoma belcheri]|nr:hypothetical protein Bbelb_229580 [Branchiostoma belcheri]